MMGMGNEEDDPIVGYEEVQPGILTLQRKNGPALTVRDEDGSIRQQVDQIVQLNNSGTPRPGGLPDQTGAPYGAPGGAGIPEPQTLSPAPIAAPAPEPVAPLAQPDAPPGLIPAQYSHTAVNPSSVAAIQGAGAQHDTARRAAAESQFVADTQKNLATAQSYDAQAKQAQADAIQAQDRIDRYQASLKGHMQEQEAARNRPIDSSKAFGGARGWFSAIAALATDRSNMYAALAGTPGKPNTVVEDLIARTVREQEQQKKLDMGAAGELAALDRAEIQANELAMREAVKRQMVAQVGKTQAGPMQAQAQANLDAFEAQTQELALKRAQGLAASDTTRFAPPAPPPMGAVKKYAESAGANRVKLEGLKQWAEQSDIPLKEAHKKYETIGTFQRSTAEVLESERVMMDLLKGSDKEGNVKGIGYLDSLAPNWMVSEEGKAVRQNFASMLDAFGRSRSGAAMPPEEVKLYRGIVQGEGTPSDLRRGIEIITRAARAERKELENEFPGLTELYSKVSDVNRKDSVSDIRKNAIRDKPKPKAQSRPLAPRAINQDEDIGGA